jgi:hypothetical protein
MTMIRKCVVFFLSIHHSFSWSHQSLKPNFVLIMNISLLSISSFAVVLGAYIDVVILDIPQILLIILFKTKSFVIKKYLEGYVVIFILPIEERKYCGIPSSITFNYNLNLLWPNFTKVYIALGKMKEWCLSILTIFSLAISVIGLCLCPCD